MKYPGAIQDPSVIRHEKRPATWGIVIHWTAGREPGDIQTLDGPDVDVQFYVDKAGRVYQFLDSDSQAWHAFHTANTYCIGIEHEGSGEPWTAAQLKASAKLARWLCDLYKIPVVHVDPQSNSVASWRGLFGHRDLAGIDGNDHTDSVPAGIGWDTYLSAIKAAGRPALIQAPYWPWLAWRLGESPFKGTPANPATRPKNWEPAVPASYWTKLKAFLAARKTPPKAPSPAPPSFGTKASAGPFAGRGIMLGANPDVWDQALGLARAREIEVVAFTPVAPNSTLLEFTDIGCEVVIWCPPELVDEAADIAQAESQAEWNKADPDALAIVANSWAYGRFDGKVALVEAYYNEGWGLNFEIFKNYAAQGAKAVIPVCGGYPAAGRSDAESARIYSSLATLPFPGFWMYAGEDELTAESVAVLKAWRYNG